MSTASSTSRPIVLYRTGPAFGLTTWDPLSLISEIYANIAKISIDYKITYYPYFYLIENSDGISKTSNINLPGLIKDDKSYNSINVIDELININNIDLKFTNKIQSDIISYKSMILNELNIIFNWMMYLDEINYDWLTSPLISKNLPIIPGFFITSAWFSSNTADKVHICEYAGIKTQEDVLLLANKLFNVLSNKLSTSNYFFGPISSIDACVAGYILLLNTIPSPNNCIKECLQNYPTLIKHSNEIATSYLPPIYDFSVRDYYEIESLQKYMLEVSERKKKRDAELVYIDFDTRNEMMFRRATYLIGIIATFGLIFTVIPKLTKKDD